MNAPAERVYGNVPEGVRHKSNRQSRAQLYERRQSALTSARNLNLTQNIAAGDINELQLSPTQNLNLSRSRRNVQRVNFLKTQQAYNNQAMLGDSKKRKASKHILAAAVAPRPPKALQVGRDPPQK
jgi:hypothetical protein